MGVHPQGERIPSNIAIARGRVQGTQVHPQGERIPSNIAIGVARGKVQGTQVHPRAREYQVILS